jgi:hypothetical protein
VPNKISHTEKSSIAHRLQEELLKYVMVSGYLFISLSLLLLYKSTVTGGEHEGLPFSLALVKALVMGKFLLIGGALKAGSLAEALPLLHRVAWKSLAFLGVLLIFTALEELIVGWFHNESVTQVLNETLKHSWLENLVPVLVMLLILIPLVCISETYRQLGPERFKQLWLARRHDDRMGSS